MNQFILQMNDVKKIIEKTSVKDLGILMNSDCSFTQHIHHVTSKTKDMCGWILQTFSSRTKYVMLTLWKALVLPHVDYYSQLWSPTRIGLIQELLNNISGMYNLNYWEQLKYLPAKTQGKISDIICVEHS